MGEKRARGIETIHQIKNDKLEIKADMLFADWIQYWYENYCKLNLAEHSRDSYELQIYQYIIPQLEGIKLSELTQNDLQQMYARLKQSGRVNRIEQRGPGLSNSFVRSCHARCYRALEKAKELGLICNNPAQGCKTPPKKMREEVRVLDQEELQRLLIQAKEDGCYELILLALATGLKRSELAALQWSDIDFEAHTVSITKRAAEAKGKLEISAPKGKSATRTLALPPSIVAVLEECKAKSNSRWLFPSPDIEDAPVWPSMIRKRLSLALEHARCKHVGFRELRHTFATNALQYGMDIKTLSAILGYQSAATTIDIYANITPDMRREAAIIIDRGIAKNESISEWQGLGKKQQMTDFQPYKGKKRKAGTGGVYHKTANSWEGRCSLLWPDGKTHTRYVYGPTREEAEEKLKTMVAELHAEREEARRLYKQAKVIQE